MMMKVALPKWLSKMLLCRAKSMDDRRRRETDCPASDAICGFFLKEDDTMLALLSTVSITSVLFTY